MDFLAVVLAEFESGPHVTRRICAETARTLLGDVVKLTNRAIAGMNARLAGYRIAFAPAEAVRARDPADSVVRVRLGGPGLGPGVPVLVFSVVPRLAVLGEIEARLGDVAWRFNTRDGSDLHDGVARGLAQLADAGLHSTRGEAPEAERHGHR